MEPFSRAPRSAGGGSGALALGWELRAPWERRADLAVWHAAAGLAGLHLAACGITHLYYRQARAHPTHSKACGIASTTGGWMRLGFIVPPTLLRAPQLQTSARSHVKRVRIRLLRVRSMDERTGGAVEPIPSYLRVRVRVGAPTPPPRPAPPRPRER